VDGARFDGGAGALAVTPTSAARSMGSQRRGNARYGVSRGTSVPLEFRVAIGARCVELANVVGRFRAVMPNNSAD